ncbi:MAG: hypothetical protein M1118_02395, partial [Chloroflexi bacterium]|nr:hypothetical protein [Chloroflexota bacterium]
MRFHSEHSTLPKSPVRHPPVRILRQSMDIVFALALILGITGFLFGPTLFHMSNWLYGLPGDGVSAAEGIAQRLQGIRAGGLLSPLPEYRGHPFHLATVAEAAEPLTFYRSALVAQIVGAVAAANTIVLLGFVLTGMALFLLLKPYMATMPALLGCIAYTFAPIRLAESREHFDLLDGFWLVLLVFLLISWKHRGGWRLAVIVGMVTALTELDNPYLGYFALLITLGIIAIRVASGLVRRHFRFVLAVAIESGCALLAIALIVLPSQFKLYQHTVLQPIPTAGTSLVRPLADLNRYSLRWWDFFLPFPENPILGPLGRSTFYAHLGADTVTEQSVMTGYIALILAIAGAAVTLRLTRRARRTSDPAAAELTSSSAQQKQRELALIAGVCIVAGILFGLPPLFHVGGLAIPSPTYFAHAIFPEIRTLSRIDLIIQLGVAILAALGAQALLARIHSTSRRNLLAGALIVGILLEYTNVPPWRYVKLLPAPRVYDWLASLSSQQAGIIAQYPLVSANLAPTPLYAFYAYEIHHHPLFNGVTPDTPPDALRRNLEDPLNPTAPASFAALGVKTIVIDTADFNQTYGMQGLRWAGREPNLESRLPMGLQLEYVGAQFRGYRITAAPASVLAGLPARYGDADIRRDGRVWQRIGATTNIWVDNVTHETVPAVLWTQIHNNRAAHTAVVPGYQPVPVSLASDATPVALPVLVPPGIHAVPLRVLGPDQPMAGTDNPTPVTVEVRSLEPAP